MTQVKIKCDRCGQWVEGILSLMMTGGFYNVSQPYYLNDDLVHTGGAWQQFGREGEDYICDHCMWLDPAYIAMYQHDAEAQKWREEQGLNG